MSGIPEETSRQVHLLCSLLSYNPNHLFQYSLFSVTKNPSTKKNTVSLKLKLTYENDSKGVLLLCVLLNEL